MRAWAIALVDNTGVLTSVCIVNISQAFDIN